MRTKNIVGEGKTNLSYFGLTYHALDVHQQWPKTEQCDRAEKPFVRSGVSIPMGDGIRQRRLPKWADRGVKQDTRHDGSPVLVNHVHNP